MVRPLFPIVFTSSSRRYLDLEGAKGPLTMCVPLKQYLRRVAFGKYLKITKDKKKGKIPYRKTNTFQAFIPSLFCMHAKSKMNKTRPVMSCQTNFEGRRGKMEKSLPLDFTLLFLSPVSGKKGRIS